MRLKSRRNSVVRFVGGILVVVVAATAWMSPAQAEASRQPSSRTSVAALAERSAAIPPQAVWTADAQAAFDQPFNEPVWTRTCDRGYGLEIWNDIPATNCAGTVHYYYYNVEKAKVNMAAYMAGPGVHIYETLNNWCNSHSLMCNGVFALVGLGLSFIFGPQ